MILKKKILIFIIFVISLALMFIYVNSSKTSYFPIKKISYGKKLENSNEEDLTKIIKNYLDDKSFFNFKISYLILELEKSEWVRNVNIRRVYPNEVRIIVEEHEPVAIWNRKKYINSFGESFYIEKITKNLPLLLSEEERIDIVFNYFSQFNKNLKENGIDQTISKIEENEIRSLTIFLNSGFYIKLGSKDLESKINLFFKVYKSLKTRDLKKIRYIDMRYSNGFSLGFE